MATGISAMISVYAIGVLPPKSIRACFLYLANAEGAGKTLLVKLATVPVAGFAPNSVLPKDEDEMRKCLLSAVMEAKPVLCFDNFKGHLASESLEGFLTSQDWTGRILGGQSTFRGATRKRRCNRSAGRSEAKSALCPQMSQNCIDERLRL